MGASAGRISRAASFTTASAANSNDPGKTSKSDPDDVGGGEVPFIPFSLADLKAEVEVLRCSPRAYVSHIGHLHTPTMTCKAGHLLKVRGDDGPWDLIVNVSGSTKDEAYGAPFRFRLRFDKTYPMMPPKVRFQCVIHHAFADEDGSLPERFLRVIPRDDRRACTVELMVRAVHDFLVDPLSSVKISPQKAPHGLIETIKGNGRMNAERLSVIRRYTKLIKHPELFKNPASFEESWFDPGLWRATQENTPEAWHAILTENLPGEVFSFKMFTDAFCETLVEEIFSFYASGLPARRPNSMNNYGIILNEIGMEPFIDALQQLLQPIGELLFPGAGNVWDGHHCFIVRYREGEDLGLDMHTDDSDVTFNICLGLDFDGAGLQFCGQMGMPNHRKHTYTHKHVKGSCVCHLGRKRHGADDISSGERLNLILWNHSSTYRSSHEYTDPPYSKEVGPPDEVCVSYTHDRDYGNYKEYPAGKEHFRGRGWCPPKPMEYKGFTPDCDKEIRGG